MGMPDLSDKALKKTLIVMITPIKINSSIIGWIPPNQHLCIESALQLKTASHTIAQSA
jgi:hypothetical protein